MNGASGSSALPFTRSRTNLFLSYRASSARASPYASTSSAHRKGKGKDYSYDEEAEGEESRGLMQDSASDVVLNMELLPPKWVDIAEKVDAIVINIRPKSMYYLLLLLVSRLQANSQSSGPPSPYYIVAQLDKLHAKHVLPGFNDRSAEEREISAITGDITRVRHRACRRNDLSRSLPEPRPLAGFPHDTAAHSTDCRNVQDVVIIRQWTREPRDAATQLDYDCQRAVGTSQQSPGTQWNLQSQADGVSEAYVVSFFDTSLG